MLSQRNSSSSPLDAGGVFTGGADDVAAYAGALISIFSDVGGSYEVQGSANGSDWDSIHANDTYVPAPAALELTIPATARFFRVQYTNGGSPQTFFRLTTKYVQAPASVSIDGPVATTSEQSITSTGNATAVPLLAAAVFTGAAELNAYADVMVVVAADVAGTYALELSVDGTNWDSSISYVYDPARANPPHVLVKGSRYFRVVFTNGPTNQAFFRLTSFYGSFRKLTSSLNRRLPQSYDAIATRPSDYATEVASGRREGVTGIHIIGNNSTIGTTFELLAAIGGAPWMPLTSAESWEIVSADANDTAAGTGAQSVTIVGINASGDEATEVIAMNGTTAVPVPGTWLSVNRLYVDLAGTGLKNAGAITLQVSGGGAARAQIIAGESRARLGHYKAPSTCKLYLNSFRVLSDKPSGSATTLEVRVMAFDPAANTVSVLVDESSSTGTPVSTLATKIPFELPAGSEVWVEGLVGAGTADVGVLLDAIQIRD